MHPLDTWKPDESRLVQCVGMRLHSHGLLTRCQVVLNYPIPRYASFSASVASRRTAVKLVTLCVLPMFAERLQATSTPVADPFNGVNFASTPRAAFAERHFRPCCARKRGMHNNE